MRIVSPYECRQEFFAIEPHSIMAPFKCRLVQQLGTATRILTQPECAFEFDKPMFNVRVLKNLHTKLAIGNRGALVGSWNFSLSNYNYDVAPTTMIDLVFRIEPNESLFQQLKTLFEHHWNMAKKPIEVRAVEIIPTN